MKHHLFMGAALLALSACSAQTPTPAPVPESNSAASILDSITPDTDLETLLQLEKEFNAKLESQAKTLNETAAQGSKLSAAIGAAYLKNNAGLEGVVTSESGLQYKVVQAGLENGASAAPGQGIAANYHGFFINGDTFDSSYSRGRPLEGPSNGFIKGWNEALGEMKVCEARTLYINSDLAYGDNGRGGIPGGSTLLFHMQLLAVQGTEEGLVYECPADKILAGPDAY